MNDFYLLYPFLDFLGGIDESSAPVIALHGGKNVVLLLSLDSSHSVVLPIGTLEASFREPKRGGKLASRRNGKYPQGVRVYEDDPCGGSEIDTDQPDLDFSARGESIMIQWTLDSNTFAKAVARSANGPTSAGLPPHLSAVIFRNIEEPPFSLENFASPGKCSVWPEEGAGDEKTSAVPFAKSRLKLVPNGRTDLPTMYRLTSTKRFCLADDYNEGCNCSGQFLKFEIDHGT
jgi:hypothetical protein